MGRPCKPTALLEMSGAFKKHPERRRARANEPKSTRLFDGPPPAQFLIKAPDTGYQRAERWLREWEELKLEAPDMSFSSRGSIITLCMLKAELWSLPTGSRRLEVLADRETKLRGSLGLTETTRPKVNAGYTDNNGPGSALASLAKEGRERNRA